MEVKKIEPTFTKRRYAKLRYIDVEYIGHILRIKLHEA